jgi:hypothetical protein
MNKLNLILKFKLAGDGHFHVKGAARIRVDGRGGLMLYGTQSGAVETIDLQALRSLSIQQVSPARVHLAVA